MNFWKERNRRIFNNAQESAIQVASRIKEDIEQRKRDSKGGLASRGFCLYLCFVVCLCLVASYSRASTCT